MPPTISGAPLPDPITEPPGKDELAARLARVQSRMRAEGLDAYVSFDPVNVYYLTNFANNVHERPFLLVIPPQGTPTIVAPLLETSHVRARARCDLEYATYYEFPAPEGENWWDVYAQVVDAGARVGIEPAMPSGIRERTPGTTVISDIIDDVRIVKSAYEIGRNVHACRVVELGHEKLLENARPGTVVGALYAASSQAMMARILGDIPHANLVVTRTVGAVWPPSISHDPHLIPTFGTQIEDGGPHVTIAFCQVDGYGVELERTFFLGHVPDDARAPFDAMLEARSRAYELARPGADMGEVDRAVRKVIFDRGYGEQILHRTGHGFGITGHEAPYLADGYSRDLEPGMLISIEPGIYIPGQGGFRYSDTVLITDDGCLSLTHAPQTLEELTLPL
ncbi:MAG: aminopeptidase P family protein [Deltaproteobacteria bacterium]|nr:aminopeptidase P family protein [Deltaproteobacteria bacterium]MBW2372041.1 aminopeptidase P family protein [Deltaproteobacteria bacterium]